MISFLFDVCLNDARLSHAIVRGKIAIYGRVNREFNPLASVNPPFTGSIGRVAFFVASSATR